MRLDPHTRSLQRRLVAVLAAWLCVLMVSGVSPWMQRQAVANAEHHMMAPAAMERLCVGDGPTQWVASPFVTAQQPSTAHSDVNHHVLACALCLPVLATAGVPWMPLRSLPLGAVPSALPAEQCGGAVAALPPVRAPPAVVAIS